jgi:hypothetical protein
LTIADTAKQRKRITSKPEWPKGRYAMKEPTVSEGAGVPASSEWEAWINEEPPGQPIIHVHGSCVVTMGGHARLVKSNPQGINAAYLVLDLVVDGARPIHEGPNPVTTVPVRYDEVAQANYEWVRISDDREPDGVVVPVKHVS